MIRLNLIVEGATEETFVRDLLGPYLAGLGVFVSARSVESGRRGATIHRGGMTSYDKAKKDLRRWLAQDDAAFLSTMFDLYALPRDFPAFAESRLRADPYERVAVLEEAFFQDIGDRRFIPYIQLHEFEGLLFSGVEVIDEALRIVQKESQLEGLRQIRFSFQTPEHINDGAETAPSRRLCKLFKAYDKPVFGSLIAERLGLARMRSECIHFGKWLSRLERLGATPDSQGI
jgi:hypothetical protein